MGVRNPLVTVVIPVFNGAKCIADSIKSVQSQTLSDWEIVCVDDGSTDSTKSVIERLRGDCPAIRMVVHEKSRGPLSARLSGVKVAKGDYVAFLDCGDRLSRDGLQQMVLAATSTDADVVVGASKLRMPHLGMISYSKPRLSFYRYVDENTSKEDLNKQIYKGMLDGSLMASIWDKIYSRSWLLEHLPSDQDFRIGEDYYFISVVMAHARKIHFADAEFYEWTYSGMARKYFLEGYAENFRVMNFVFDSVGIHAQSCGLSEDEAKRAVAYKLVYQVLLGVAEHYRQSYSWKKTKFFAEKLLQMPEMKRALSYLSDFKGQDASNFTADKMIALAKEHLHKHRKFYIFTRLLYLIYRV